MDGGYDPMDLVSHADTELAIQSASQQLSHGEHLGDLSSPYSGSCVEPQKSADAHVPELNDWEQWQEQMRTDLMGLYPTSIEELDDVPMAPRQSSNTPWTYTAAAGASSVDDYNHGASIYVSDTAITNSTQHDFSTASYTTPYSQTLHNDYPRVPSPACSDVSITPGVVEDVLKCRVEGCIAKFNGVYRRGNLARHIRLSHSSDQIYLCGIDGCRRTYKRSDARKKHQRSKHILQ